MSVIWEGVCDRYPEVRIGFMESGGGWIAPWLDRMDRHFDDQGFNDSGLTMRPSELFQRNCWISFEPVERSLSVLADYIGPHKILWATDYPHPDGFFPGAPKLIMDRPELSAATKRADHGRRRQGLLQAGGRRDEIRIARRQSHTAAPIPTRPRDSPAPPKPRGFDSLWVADHVVLPDPPVPGRPMAPDMRPARSDRRPHLPGCAHRSACCSAPA